MALTRTSSTFFPTQTTFSTSTTSSYSADIITTPYTFRPTCDPHVLATLTTASPPTPYALRYSTFLCVEPYSSGRQDCQPHTRSRIDGGYLEDGVYRTKLAGERGIFYTAAVCPEGWWALDVYAGGTTTGGSVYGESSYATCCKSGDTLTKDLFALYWTSSYGERERSICVNSWSGSSRFVESRVKTRTGFAATGGTVTVPITEGTAYYPGWTIMWKSTDTKTLSPEWPTLTSDMLIPTWTPGMVIRDGQYDKKAPINDATSEEGGGEEGEKKTWGEDVPNKAWKGIVIGAVLGFIGLVALLVCCCSCVADCCNGAKERKERRRAAPIPPLRQRVREKFVGKKKVGDAGEGGTAVRMTEVKQDVPEAAKSKWWRWNSSGGKGKTAAEQTGIKASGDNGDAKDAAAQQAAYEAELARRFAVLRRQMAEGKNENVEIREVRPPMSTYQRESERK